MLIKINKKSWVLIPGIMRPRGGEFAAEDCWLDGYHEEREPRPYWVVVGEVVPEVWWGDPAVEYLLGDTLVEYAFGARDGVINLCPTCLGTANQKHPKKQNIAYITYWETALRMLIIFHKRQAEANTIISNVCTFYRTGNRMVSSESICLVIYNKIIIYYHNTTDSWQYQPKINIKLWIIKQVH